MSFIHKILDRASRHTAEEKPQRRSFFGFGVTNKDEKPKMEEETIEKSALTASSIHTIGKKIK